MTEPLGEAGGVEGADGRGETGQAYQPPAVDDVGGVEDPADEGSESVGDRDVIELPEPPPTGDDLVDEAIARAAQVAAEPPEAQVEVIEAVHRTLQDRLADVEA